MDNTAEWTRSDSDRAAVADGCFFDLPAAERVRDFGLQFIRHSKGEWAGKPFELLPWQWRDVVAPLFGWKRADGTRRYRMCYIEVPKKNGKTTLLSFLGVYLMVGDGEPGAEVYTAAADHKQAALIFDEARNMVRQSESLRDRIMVTASQKHMSFPQQLSKMQALSADAFTKEGLNAHAILFDELHAQKTRVLWDTLLFAGVSRRNPLHISITTAGYDRNSICWEQHDYATKVIDGHIEDWSFLAVVYGADEDADWTDPAVWEAANPSYGVTIQADSFEQACKSAQESPTKENAFRRYRLNQWTEQETRWLSMAAWDECGAEAIDMDALLGQPCWAGLDLSTTTDISALSLMFKLPNGGGWAVLPFFWVPAERARERENRDRVPYSTWASSGLIEMTPGNVIDYGWIRKRIRELGSLYKIQEVAYDRWNATQMVQDLQDQDGVTMTEWGQGFRSMSDPTKQMEKIILAREFQHGGHPVLRWMASNVTVKTDPAGNIKPVKPEHQSAARIDGIVATIMALGVGMVGQEQPESIYNTRGILQL